MSDKLLEQVFNLKFTAKQLNRSAVKAEKDEKAERLKVRVVASHLHATSRAHPLSSPAAARQCTNTPSSSPQNTQTPPPKQHQVKRAIEKGNVEGAKIYAQNAIRKKHEQLNFLRLASRLDAVVSRLETQAKMQMVNRNMVGITKNLERALASNNLEQIAATMQQFERQFEDLEIQTATVDGVMAQQAALSTPEEEVTALMQQVADEHGLEVQVGLPGASTSVPAAVQAAPTEQDPLSRRLAELRGR